MSKLCTECPFEMFVFFYERKQEFWKERRKAQDLGTLGSPFLARLLRCFLHMNIFVS